MQISKITLVTQNHDVKPQVPAGGGPRLVDSDTEIRCEITGPKLVARGQRARFIIRPQCVVVRPHAFEIENPRDWKVYDVNLCGRSQFTRTGDDERDAVAGDMIARLVCDTIQTAMPLWIDVVYEGTRPDAPFLCTIRGMAAV